TRRAGADAGGGVAVDELALHRLSGVRGVPLPRVLGGVLRHRLPRAARRRLDHRPGRGPHELPQLGLSTAPADLLRLPLRPRCLAKRPSPVSASTSCSTTATASPPSTTPPSGACVRRRKSCRRSGSTTGPGR